MRKYLALLLTLFSFLIMVPVYAEETCTYKEEAELREKASNIKADYEIKEETISPGSEDTAAAVGYYFTISVLNITDEFYVEVTNNIDNKKEILSYNSDNEGIVTFDWKKSSKITDFTFKVYTTNGNKCNGIALKTFHLKTPRYNPYYQICYHDYPNYSLCQQFVEFDEMDIHEFSKRLDAYKESLKKATEEEQNKSVVEKVIEFVDKYKWVVFGVVIVTGAGTCTYLYFSKKKQRDLGL